MNSNAIHHSVNSRTAGIQASSASHMPAHFGLNSAAPRARRGPHPGDILFWVACVGGAGLLLFLAT
jgi:hypothetical protein